MAYPVCIGIQWNEGFSVEEKYSSIRDFEYCLRFVSSLITRLNPQSESYHHIKICDEWFRRTFRTFRFQSIVVGSWSVPVYYTQGLPFCFTWMIGSDQRLLSLGVKVFEWLLSKPVVTTYLRGNDAVILEVEWSLPGHKTDGYSRIMDQKVTERQSPMNGAWVPCSLIFVNLENAVDMEKW